MIVTEDYGQPLTYEMQTAAADTALTIFNPTWKISIYRLRYDSGGTGTPAEGGLLVGASSGATAIILEVPNPLSGTWAGGDAAGYLYIHNWNEIAWTDDENINYVAPATNSVSANAATVDIGMINSDKSAITNAYGTFVEGMVAKCAIVTCETQDMRIMTDGTAPTPATHANGLPSRGVLIAAGGNQFVYNTQQIKQIRTCNKTASSNHARRIVCYF